MSDSATARVLPAASRAACNCRASTEARTQIRAGLRLLRPRVGQVTWMAKIRTSGAFGRVTDDRVLPAVTGTDLV
ncbi:hypothetical protein GCM10010495_52320 [Kitasatospora herbaricolor]|nr:hypothetical protein GCM10010495_52320 [Kitasatospora herbaricolor]